MTGLVVDASAVVAVIARESTHGWIAARMDAATGCLISAPTVLEAGMVLEARAGDPGIVSRALTEFGIEVSAFTSGMADRGMHAWRRFGKGRHAAALNFGDCCTYALAEHLGLPILCTGDDFARTGWEVLRPPA